MGLWDWVLRILSQPDQGPVERVPHRHADAAKGTTTATLEPCGEASSSSDEPRWYRPAGATLVELVAPPRPEGVPELRALENLLVSHFDGHNLHMPPLLRGAQRVLDRLRKKNVDAKAVARDIGEDQVIAAAVIRMANSPLYRGAYKTATLDAAVTRLGFRAIRTLMLHQSLRAVVFDTRSVEGRFATRLWRRSLAAGCIMRGLAKLTSREEDDALLQGLLHDIGSVLVLRILRENRVRPLVELDDATFEFLACECHQELGELIAQSWQLPDELKGLIADHHTPPRPDDPLRTERLQLQLTEMILALLDFTPFTPYDLMASRPASELGLRSRPGFTDFLDALPGELEEAFQDL